MTDDTSDDQTTDETVNTTPEWWASIVEHVAAHEADVPDPWADVSLRSAALTADQESFLAGFDDQPPLPHVGDVDPLDVGGAR